MKQIVSNSLHYSLALIILITMVSCGNQQPDSLAAKKGMLKNLKNEAMTLNQQIRDLEAEIAAQDPMAAAQVRRARVTIDSISPQTFDHYLSVQGMVETNQNVEVSPSSPGIIVSILVREGQRVKKGQTLARLDDDVQQRSIEEITTQLELARIIFQKQERLWQQEIGTEVQYLTAKNQMESLERRLETLKAQQDDLLIQAPISGTIDEIYPKVGEAASPGLAAFRIVNSRNLNLKAELSENHVSTVKTGTPVEISFPILNKSFKAKVSHVGQAINPTNRTFEIEVKLPNDPLLKPNMFGEISINDQTFQDAIVIPLSLLQQSDQGKFIYVAEKQSDDKWLARRRDIETGLTYESKVLVLDGLKSGDMLIITGYNNLSDGQELSIEEPV